MSVWKTLKQALSRWYNGDSVRLSAALAYYTLFSLGPLLLIAIGVAGLFFDETRARRELLSQLRTLMGPAGVDAVSFFITHIEDSTTNRYASAIGFGILLLGATGVFLELQADLNRIWKCPAPRTSAWKSFLLTRLLSFAMVLSTGFLLLVSLLINATIAGFGHYLEDVLPFSRELLQALSMGLTFVLTVLLFTLIFKVLPDCRVAWRACALGGLATAALFSLGKFGIGLYLAKSAIASIYGASASAVIVLLWTYYSALILFFGAHLTYVLCQQPKKSEPTGSLPPGTLGATNREDTLFERK